MIKRIINLLLLMFSISMVSIAQTDTEFWFAAPDLEVNHAQEPVRFCVVSYETAATVTFEQPANAFYSPQTFHLGANDCHVYDVSDIIGIVETQPYNTVLDYGFHIYSDAPVSIYYESDNNNSEIYSLKGRNALGTSFVVPMQYTYENYYSSTCSRIEVVASEDDTEVVFYPSVPIKGGGLSGMPVTVTLNRGQSYAIEAASREGSAHLRNTRVTATKPIAVNSSDDSVNLNEHYDLVGDQIVPIDLLGTQYIAIWNNNSSEYLYFFPTEDNTQIYLNGSPDPVATLNVGEEFSHHINSSVVYINANHPLAVFQLSASSMAEMGGTVLPQINCTGSRKTVYKRQSNSNLVVTLIVRTPYTDGFALNGNTTHISASDFTAVPANPDYSYCRKNVTNYVPNNGIMTLENTYDEGFFHLGILTGDEANTWTYGYFSDYQPYAFAEFEMESSYCAGENIIFNYTAESVSNLALILPDGSMIPQPPFVLENVQPENSGRYTLQGDGCSGTQILDYIDIEVGEAGHVDVELQGCNEVIWNGLVFDHSIDSTWTMPGNPQNTCDSIYHLHIDVYHDEVVTLDAVAECDEYSWHGTTYITSGIFEYQIITPDGCTYTEYLPLTINHSDTIDYTLTACEEYVWHGTTYTQSGNYNYLTTTPEGCSRLERLSLTIGDEYHQVDEISTCGSYFWPVNQQWYSHSILDSIVHHGGQGVCDSIFVLQLDLGNFDSVEISVPEEDHCDGYLWNPQGHVFTTDDLNPEDYYFTQSGTYKRIYTNSQGCDSIVVLDAQFEYSPNPTEIYPVDENNEAPHWVITATEFQINSYDFHFWDNNDQCQWESVRWEFETPNIHWILDPDSTTHPAGKACRIYVLEHVEDTVWVRATAYNDCKPEGVSSRYWLVGSFYETDEQKAEVKVYPNPTDDIFTVEAENIEHIRVFDMMGQILVSDEYDNAHRAVVNLSHLAPAIYQVEIKTSDGIITKRIIRSR